ncbi:MAG: YbhB/YbcL family Raf kinase inhibitor-like protein [Acidobacteriia bacterium]|nr:YbhB/YbcL family Raf kinase inhibitor-like protein [Terriglobia bacterium]
MRISVTQSFKALALLAAAGILPAAAQQAAPPAAPPGPQFLLSSPGYADGADIPVKYSCSATPAAVSPALQWSNIPKGAASLTLIFHDPDAHPAKGMSDVTHWIVWNIPATATQLPENVPAGPKMDDGAIQGKNVRGVNGYQGPCPPPGKPHHYTFELYVLDNTLDLGADASRADVMKAMDGHIIGKAVYVGFFHR